MSIRDILGDVLESIFFEGVKFRIKFKAGYGMRAFQPQYRTMFSRWRNIGDGEHNVATAEAAINGFKVIISNPKVKI